MQGRKLDNPQPVPMLIMGSVNDPEMTAAEVRILLIWRERMVDATRDALLELRHEGLDPASTLQRLHRAVDGEPGLLPPRPARDEAA